MFNNAKLGIALAVAKRVVVPVLVGAAVGWLAAHGYDKWADAVCGVANAAGVMVTECK
jgi:hypothetical protein